MKFEILTIFPEMFTSLLDSSILKRAQQANHIQVRIHNIRDYAQGKHHVTDDAPYGGGPGMVMKAEPIAGAIEAVTDLYKKDGEPAPLRVYLSPEGEVWTQALAEELAQLPAVLLLCGHYEGIDERVRELHIDREFSVGDYVVTGGELPAMILIDSMARLVPGVIGNCDSVRNDSFFGGGLLDHPHYTRPEVFQERSVPEILLSGNHAKVDEWRRQQSLTRTFKNRPDLIEKNFNNLSSKDKAFIEKLREQQASDEKP